MHPAALQFRQNSAASTLGSGSGGRVVEPGASEGGAGGAGERETVEGAGDAAGEGAGEGAGEAGEGGGETRRDAGRERAEELV